MNSLFIIDASGYLYRSYYAIRQMTNKKGVSTNALFGFIRSILKLKEEFSPTHCIVVFDCPQGAKSRRQLYPEYKAHRKETPADLIEQIGEAKAFCSLFGLPILCSPEVEADDTMASIAVWAAKEMDSDVYLCTADKDLCQLVDEKVKILKTHKDKSTGKENAILGPSEVFQAFGVHPPQIIDYLALIGDASDNIPGVKGIGPTSAAKLLQEYGTLALLYQNLSALTAKQQQLLTEGKESALLSRQLIALDMAVDFKKEADFMALSSMDREGLLAFCQKMDFHAFIKELHLLDGYKPPLSAEAAAKSSLDYQTISEPEEIIKALKKLEEAKTPICLHVEYTPGHILHSIPIGIAFCIEACKAVFIPFNSETKPHLKKILESDNVHFFGHDLKRELHALANVGIRLPAVEWDTALASYLLHSQQRQHSLDYLIPNYFFVEKIAKEAVSPKVKKGQVAAEVPAEAWATYCCQAADYTYQLKELLSADLIKRNLLALLKELELPLMAQLFAMERHGIFVNPAVLIEFFKEVTEQIKLLKEEIFALAGLTFDLNSPKQLREVLFTVLGMGALKKTDKGHLSTDAHVLAQLSKEYPIASKINDFREVEKLRSTYIEPLLQHIEPTTKRIHCTFNQTVAATGRLSCQEPNLQNIPIRTEMGQRIRQAFCPSNEEWIFLSADYSQLELRLLAHFSGDPTLIEGFNRGEDIHAYTAAIVAGVEIDQVTPAMRRQAKAVNFGVIYGQQAFGLAQELQITVKEAAKFIENYFARYSAVKKYISETIESTRKTGYAVTATGRARLIPDINSKNFPVRAAAERLAINTPLQGTAADIIKLAMLEVQKVLASSNLQAVLLLQIHDELLLELPKEEENRVGAIVRKAMEGVMTLSVPLVVDVAIGKNWKEC